MDSNCFENSGDENIKHISSLFFGIDTTPGTIIYTSPEGKQFEAKRDSRGWVTGYVKLEKD